MTNMDPGDYSRQLAEQSLAAQDPTGWFEQLYAEAATGDATVPWARLQTNEHLVATMSGLGLSGEGKRAVVIGCGLGDDAEYLAALGYATVAFDISPSAVDMARKRFPESTVDYTVADLFTPPSDWLGAYDLVVEIATVQALPVSMRADAIAHVGRLVAPDGLLIVIARGRPDGTEPGDGPPWPLSRSEVDSFATNGLTMTQIETVPGRWIATFTRP